MLNGLVLAISFISCIATRHIWSSRLTPSCCWSSALATWWGSNLLVGGNRSGIYCVVCLFTTQAYFDWLSLVKLICLFSQLLRVIDYLRLRTRRLSFIAINIFFLDRFKRPSLLHKFIFLWSKAFVLHTLVISSYFVKVVEGYHHCSYVVQSLGVHTLMENFVNNKTCLLMNWYWATFQNGWVNIAPDHFVFLEITCGSIPSSINDLLVVQLFEDSITAKNNEVIVVSDFETLDVRGRDDAHWVSSISYVFGFNVSDCPWNWKTSREYSVWPDDHLHSWSILRRRVWNVAFVLINLTSILFDSLCLHLILWFVILRKKKDFLSTINWHYSSAVSNVCHVAGVSNNEHNNGACTTSFNEVIFWTALVVCPFKKHPLWLCNSVFNGHFWVLREVVISDDQLMELISKVISASCSSMAVIDCKERTSRPFFDLLELWLDNIEDNRHSVFVIVSYNTLVSVSRVTADHSVLLAGKLCGVVRRNVSFNLFLLHFHVLLLLLGCHDEPTIGHKLILRFWLVQACATTLAVFHRACLLNLLVLRWRGLRVAWLFSLWRTILSRGFRPSWSVSLCCSALVVSRLAGCLRFVSNSGACSKSVDSIVGQIGAWSSRTQVCIVACARLRLRCTLPWPELISCCILSIAVLFDQLLLLLQKKSLWWVVVDSACCVKNWVLTVLSLIVLTEHVLWLAHWKSCVSRFLLRLPQWLRLSLLLVWLLVSNDFCNPLLCICHIFVL